MRQVLQNLVLNVRQAMQDGGEVRLVARNVHKVDDPQLDDGPYVETR